MRGRENSRSARTDRLVEYTKERDSVEYQPNSRTGFLRTSDSRARRGAVLFGRPNLARGGSDPVLANDTLAGLAVVELQQAAEPLAAPDLALFRSLLPSARSSPRGWPCKSRFEIGRPTSQPPAIVSTTPIVARSCLGRVFAQNGIDQSGMSANVQTAPPVGTRCAAKRLARPPRPDAIVTY